MPSAGVPRRLLRAVAILATSVTTACAIDGQCRPPANSNEARLLAYYSAPVVLSPQTMPLDFAAGWLSVSGDVAYIPRPDPSLQRSGRCFMPKDESTHLTSFLPRPRVAVTLPHGLMLEASYLPPVRVAGAKANLLSGAASLSRAVGSWLGGPVVGTVRAHFTRGTIRGSITCARHALQQSDPGGPCYGTNPSYDSFQPNVWGAEAMLSRTMLDGRLGVYGGGGPAWLRPRFQSHFLEGTGFLDATRIEVDLTRVALFTGAEYRVGSRWSATAQLYSVPEDVTLFRVGAAASVGGR